MPVRSLRSSVLKWPDAQTVQVAVRRWAQRLAEEHPDVLRVGYFGSYARGDAGVGSDLDVILIVDRTETPFWRRAADWDATDLPVPTDILVYTSAEWQAVSGRFGREVVWVYIKGEHS